MISNTTFKNITNLTLMLKQKNITLEVDPESPVGILNRAGYTPLLTNSNISDEEFFTELPASLKRDVITGESEVVSYTLDGKPYKEMPVAAHEQTFESVKNITIESCLQLLMFCRDVAHPAIDSVFKRYDDPTYLESSEFWSLVPVPSPDYLESNVVSAILSRIPDGAIDPHYPCKKPRIPEDLELPKSGHAEFDNVVKMLIGNLNTTPAKVLADVWDQTDYVGSGVSTAWMQIPKQTLRLLLMTYFKDNPWDDSGLNKPEWDTSFETSMIKLGQWINSHMFANYERLQNGLILSGIDYDTRSAYIYEEPWAMYLEEGGTPESLHGALYRLTSGTEDITITTETLLNDSKANVMAWETYHNVQTTNNEAEWMSSVKNRISSAVIEWYESVEDKSIFSEHANAAGIKEIIRAHVRETLDKHELEDMTRYLINLLFRTVFSHVDGRKLMLDIHDSVKEGMPIKNASYLAVRKYVENYVLSGYML